MFAIKNFPLLFTIYITHFMFTYFILFVNRPMLCTYGLAKGKR